MTTPARHGLAHVVHDVIDYALHHPIRLPHHDHPDHHHPPRVHAPDGIAVDDLEGRTLMSAAVHSADPLPAPPPPSAITLPDRPADATPGAVRLVAAGASTSITPGVHGDRPGWPLQRPSMAAEAAAPVKPAPVKPARGPVTVKPAAKPASKPTARPALKPAAVAPRSADPAAIPDPAVTDARLVYRSYATAPLFGPAGPAIADVSQGGLGDCYLMSVLSTIAKASPTAVRQLITANANGTFTVHFGGPRRPTLVTVDADLPSLPGTTARPAYAQLGTGGCIWVALVEKAYTEFAAPRADSYAAIEGGWMGDAFTAVGLRPTSTFSTASPAALAALVQQDLKAGDCVTLGTVASRDGKNPLVPGHAYEVDAVTVDRTGKVLTITLRNPWGTNVADGGYVTVTVAQAYAAFAGLAVAHV